MTRPTRVEGTSEPADAAIGGGYARYACLAGLLVLVILNHPVLAEGVISSDKLIEKLAIPQVQPRGLVKTTGPEVAIGNSEAGAGVATGSVMLQIQFAYDSSQLSAASRGQLNELGKALNSQELRPFSFEIAGHTDGQGDRDYNRQLSVRRAGAVKAYLSQNLGVSRDRLRTVGWGEDRPLIPGDPYNPANRRVEIINLGR